MTGKRLLSCIAALLSCLSIYARQESSFVHRVGVSVRPAWNQMLWDFYQGDNPSGRPIPKNTSVHFQYSFMFPKGSDLGDMFPTAYQGIGLAPYTFHNRTAVGTPVALYVFQGGSLARLGRHFSLDYEWNFGATFGWKKSSVVGTSVNAFIDAALMLTWCPVPQFSVTAGVDAFHFSNGSVKLPNNGLNCLGVRVGATRTFGVERLPEAGRKNSRQPEDAHPFIEDLDIDLVLFGAPKQVWEYYSENRTFAVAGFNLNPMYQVNHVFRVGASFDLQYDGSVSADHPSFGENVSAGLSFRTEFVMPIFSLNIGAGYDIKQKGNNQRMYMLVALKTWMTDSLFLHTGYMFRGIYYPEHLMLGVGWSFGR